MIATPQLNPIHTDMCLNRHGGNPESNEAYESIKGEAPQLRAKVWRFVQQKGDEGATCFEVSQALGMLYPTASARITELKARGALIDSGQRRKTPAGRNAAVLVSNVPVTIKEPAYDAFLAKKKAIAPVSGFDAKGINQKLFDWQQEAVSWALQQGRAALWEDCGLGKTFQQLEWGREVCDHTKKNVLIAAPLAVNSQTVAEGEKLGIEVHSVRSQNEVRPGINITNYEMIEAFDPSQFAGVVLDECFVAGTLIDTPSGQRRIEEIRVGDEIMNAFGVDVVADVHRREVQYAIRITIQGKPITCSPNHPFFTQRGWVGAQDLMPGDRIMETSEAVRMVRKGVRSEVRSSRQNTILRSILLSEMAHESAGALSQGSQPGSCEEEGAEEIGLVTIRQSEGEARDRACPAIESYVATGSEREDLPPIESHEAQTFRAWGQRDWFDSATTDTAGCVGQQLDGGICFITGETNSRLSHELQARLSERRAQNSHRGGWQLPLCEEVAGSEERSEIGFYGVESLEVLELGHPELDRLRDAEGKLYFYDLGATQHPSFSVNGCLVHNSSILKSFMGKTKRYLVEAFASTPYKLAYTATPAPNDHMEIGNHADFLSVMPSSEMLARWFINDTMKMGTYRLKGHAEADFWQWVASWAISMRKPSDLGNYSDEGYVLPPRNMQQVSVDVDDQQETNGALFRMPTINATTMHKEMRLTCEARASMARDIISQRSNEAHVVWCNTNYEADALKLLLPDAVEVRGSDSVKEKERKLTAFSNGEERIIITKPSIAGFGLNWQHCHNAVFVGLSYSFEQFYQALRRNYRFGQTQQVNATIVTARTEGAILQSLYEKMAAHETMMDGLVTGRRNAKRGHLRLIEGGGDVQVKLPEWLKAA